METEKRTPRELVKKMKDMGFYSIQFPEMAYSLRYDQLHNIRGIWISKLNYTRSEFNGIKDFIIQKR
jgi:alkylation response protein AidB-like acyl-CoA dehydrogenase